MKITPHPLIKEMSGKVFGHKERISMRMHYGQLRSYTYQNKPEEWSEGQIAHRELFGASSYMARLILRIDAAKMYYEELRRQEKFVRLDNYVAKKVRALCEEDADLKTQVVAANEAHRKVKGQKDKEESLLQEQVALAEQIWHKIQ